MLPQGLRKGSAIGDVLIGAAIIVFVILPVFSVIMEKYIILNKAQIIKDAIDMTNISVYNAMNTGNLGKVDVEVEMKGAEDIYRRLLAQNLKLDNSLFPLPHSIAEDRVEIESIIFYTGVTPEVCPEGKSINRATVHSVVKVPIRPSLYRSFILNMLGKQFVELHIHVDSELPVNR